MKVKVFLNNVSCETIEGDGTADEMGITISKPVSVVVAGKENEVTMIMVPWSSIVKFEYTVTEDMIRATTQQANNMQQVQEPNRKARRAALQQ